MSAIPCRLLIDPPAGGARNMAIDDVLLQSASEHSTCTLRFYTWAQPTLSLGYFQSYRDREQHPGSLSCPVVRRATGGGAILHDRELTYSLALPRTLVVFRDACELYRAIHRAVTAALIRIGVEGDLGLCGGPIEDGTFLCFKRRATGDILLRGEKIGGSAQRRTRGAILQHGSVLLECSRFAPELPGIAELSGRRVVADELAEQLKISIALELGVELVRGKLTEAEQAAVASIIGDRYESRIWTLRR